jgi:hypothetical protein
MCPHRWWALRVVVAVAPFVVVVVVVVVVVCVCCGAGLSLLPGSSGCLSMCPSYVLFDTLRCVYLTAVAAFNTTQVNTVRFVFSLVFVSHVRE